MNLIETAKFNEITCLTQRSVVVQWANASRAAVNNLAIAAIQTAKVAWVNVFIKEAN